MSSFTLIAIHYHPDAFMHPPGKILGRQSAGAGFLEALLRQTSGDRVYCYAQHEEHFKSFQAKAAELAWPCEQLHWIAPGDQAALAEVGCLYHPEPTLDALAWNRQFAGSTAYSLCGVNHTVCSAGVMGAIANLVIAPTEPWDALICTSTAAKAAIQQLLAQWTGYLQQRLGAICELPLELPVIPLGVDCEAFCKAADDKALRVSLRGQLGAADDDLVVLYVGRLSYHAKAHPLPMYLALEAAARRTGKRLHLVQCGWFANAALRRDFETAARAFCPSVRAVFIDGTQPGVSQSIWQAADIFTSLADNIQETVGLTPIEAMAAGLPVVVSDWDGYRDTVRHGIDGFRVPTLMPPAGSGGELSRRYALGIDNYDHYIGYASQLTAVDVPSCTDAFVQLIEHQNLRRSMGDAGRERAQSQFDWRQIIRAYEELWAELTARRQHARPVNSGIARGSTPLRDDPFRMFAGFSTQALDSDLQLILSPAASSEQLNELMRLPMTNFAARLLASVDECQEVLQYLGKRGSATVGEIVEAFPSERKATFERTLGWLAKVDLVRAVGLRIRGTDI